MKRKSENVSEGDPRSSGEPSAPSGGSPIQEEDKMDLSEVEIENVVCEWVREIEEVVKKEMDREDQEKWEGILGDVHGGDLPPDLVAKAKLEEVNYMQGRNLWSPCSIEECIRVSGKRPVSTRWVNTNKGGEDTWDIRCRLVARDFKGNDKDRDDLFAGTPPLEAKRILFSRAVTRRFDGEPRKLMFIDAKKAHLNPKCEDDVYIELPPECG